MQFGRDSCLADSFGLRRKRRWNIKVAECRQFPLHKWEWEGREERAGDEMRRRSAEGHGLRSRVAVILATCYQFDRLNSHHLRFPLFGELSILVDDTHLKKTNKNCSFSPIELVRPWSWKHSYQILEIVGWNNSWPQVALRECESDLNFNVRTFHNPHKD